MTCLNLETVKSVISEQSRLFRSRRLRSLNEEEEDEDDEEESTRMKCSMLFNPAEAASCMALCSSIIIFGTTIGSTTIFRNTTTTTTKKTMWFLVFRFLFGWVWFEEEKGEEWEVIKEWGDEKVKQESSIRG